MAAHAASNGQHNPAEDARAGAEWSIWYTDYLTRSATQSAKTLELFQDVLQCVSRGQLAPTALQDFMPGFAQARSAQYASKFSELSSRFFSGVVKIGTAYSREQAELLTPGRSGPDISPASSMRQIRSDGSSSSPSSHRPERESHQGVSIAPRSRGIRRTTAGQFQQASADYFARRLPEHLHEIGQLY